MPGVLKYSSGWIQGGVRLAQRLLNTNGSPQLLRSSGLLAALKMLEGWCRICGGAVRVRQGSWRPGGVSLGTWCWEPEGHGYHQQGVSQVPGLGQPWWDVTGDLSCCLALWTGEMLVLLQHGRWVEEENVKGLKMRQELPYDTYQEKLLSFVSEQWN